MASLSAADKPARPAPMTKTSQSVEALEEGFGLLFSNELAGAGQAAPLN
tara:strand:+ start:262 stop:408 length:147 start_codon:yes stop_codon:yes gene_type:complete